jgi:glycosyltransferase involved in cell wall biosynthesis
MIVIVIPAFQPDKRLIELVKMLKYETIVVDDGSGKQYDSIFNGVESSGATVLRYSKNNGKGYALKTAFKYLENDKSIDWIITADADGQHSPADIDKIIEAASNATPHQRLLSAVEDLWAMFRLEVDLEIAFPHGCFICLLAARYLIRSLDCEHIVRQNWWSFVKCMGNDMIMR